MKNVLNFGLGLIFGVISVFMWEYSHFLYYSVFLPQTTCIFIIINLPKPAIKRKEDK